ncbi:MAG: hypothetical protein IJZ62_01735 [Clostridia bacterium]|nr:hypothetical protein [Clostridia bacterium]
MKKKNIEKTTKETLSQEGLLKKKFAYSLASRLFSSVFTLPAGFYLGNSIVQGDAKHIIISSALCATMLTTGIVTAWHEEKVDKKLNELKNPPAMDDIYDEL